MTLTNDAYNYNDDLYLLFNIVAIYIIFIKWYFNDI